MNHDQPRQSVCGIAANKELLKSKTASNSAPVYYLRRIHAYDELKRIHCNRSRAKRTVALALVPACRGEAPSIQGQAETVPGGQRGA